VTSFDDLLGRLTVSGPVPAAGDSVPLGAAWRPGPGRGVDLAACGYLEEEYLVAGQADDWTWDDRLRPVPAGPRPFTTRILLRRPAAVAAFSGAVYLEPNHADYDRSLTWSATAPWLVRAGHAHVGVTQEVAVLPDLARFDTARYAALSIPAPGQRWDILGLVAALLTGGAGPGASPLAGYPVDRVIMSGWSQTGTFCRTFLGEGFHARSQAGGRPADSGYDICISSGGALRPGYGSLRPPALLPPGDPRRTIGAHGVPVIELLSEGESETHQAVLRPDADSPVSSGTVSGETVSGGPVSGGAVSGGPGSGGLGSDGTVSGGAVSGGPGSGGTGSGGAVSGGPGSDGTVSGGTGPDRTGSGGTGSDGTGFGGTGSGRTGSDRTGSGGTGSDGTGFGGTGFGGTGSNRTGPDGAGDAYRLYQVAGTGHVTGRHELATNRLQLAARGWPVPPVEVNERLPDGRMDLVARAVFAAMDRWLADGTAPPRMARRFGYADPAGPLPRGVMPESLPLARDADGNVLGGIRTPWVEVPLGGHFPHSTPLPGRCQPAPQAPYADPRLLADLWAHLAPFPAAELTRRYGNRAEYLDRFAAAARASVAEGWLLADDLPELLAGAREAAGAW
jgi:hypothetical protein